MPQTFDASGANNMQAIKDRVTKTLSDATRDMSPLDTFANIGRAAGRAATGETTYGDVKNAMEARRFQAAQQMMQMLQQEQVGQRAERQLDLSEQDLKLRQAVEQRAAAAAMAKQGHEAAKVVTDAINALPEEVRDIYFAELSDLPYEVDASNVHRAIGEVRKKLAKKGGIAAPKPFEGTSEYAQNQNILLTGDPASAAYRAAYNWMARPKEDFDPLTGRTTIKRPDMSAYRPPTGESYASGAGGTEVVQTAPARLSMEDAQANENLKMAQEDLSIAQQNLFKVNPETGELELDRWAVAAASAPGGGLPGTAGRTARQSMRRAIEILLRLRTGAAAPDSEVDSYMDQFFPSPLDKDEDAMRKMEAMSEFFAGTQQTFGASRGMTDTAPQQTQPPPSDEKAVLDDLLGG